MYIHIYIKRIDLHMYLLYIYDDVQMYVHSKILSYMFK